MIILSKYLSTPQYLPCHTQLQVILCRNVNLWLILQLIFLFKIFKLQIWLEWLIKNLKKLCQKLESVGGVTILQFSKERDIHSFHLLDILHAFPHLYSASGYFYLLRQVLGLLPPFNSPEVGFCRQRNLIRSAPW